MAGGAFEVAQEFAAELMSIAQEQVGDDSSPRAVEYLLSWLHRTVSMTLRHFRS